MKRRLTLLKALSLHEWQVLLSSMFLLPISALLLRLSGFKRTRKFMGRFLPADRGVDLSEANNLTGAKVIARIVAVAAGHGIYRSNCLKQSLVLWWLLGRRGIHSEIKIGINRDGAEPLEAHAWVECGGQVLNETEDVQQRFSAFEPN